MKFHDELNPKLWDGLELKTDVKEKLNEIAEAFKEYLDIPEDAILDERITGSSASYNYTEYSDLDLHLIIDYEKVHKDCPLVEGYLWSYKSQFNANHDISIYGVPVELYAEDSKQEAISNGVYSLMEDRWLKEPKKIPPTDNDEDVQAKYQELKDAIDKCDDSEVANELLDKIYTMRKSGLAEVGEFSTENMAFKLLRNDGSIDKLKKLKKEKVDKQLSLESYNEEIYIDEKDVPPLHDYAIIFKYQEPWPDGKVAYRAIMKLTTGSSYRMQSYGYTKEGMINIVKKKWPYADIVDKTNEPMSESYNKSVKESYRRLTKTEMEIEKLLNANGFKTSEVHQDPGKEKKIFYVDKSIKLDGMQSQGTEVSGKNFKEILKKLQDKFNKNESIKEDYEDDYEDIPEEMHKERYVTYFETQEGRQKYTIYHVYTDSTDDSYNELCDKRDNQLGMYNSYKELKDALKERAEKIAAKQGWIVKSIENLGEDDEYYIERNKWESIKEDYEWHGPVAKVTFDNEKLETLEDLKNYFDTGLETIDCEITYFPYEPTQKVLRITSASPKINREWLKEVSNGKIKLVGVKQHKNRFGGWIKIYDRFYGYVDNINESKNDLYIVKATVVGFGGKDIKYLVYQNGKLSDTSVEDLATPLPKTQWQEILNQQGKNYRFGNAIFTFKKYFNPTDGNYIILQYTPQTSEGTLTLQDIKKQLSKQQIKIAHVESYKQYQRYGKPTTAYRLYIDKQYEDKLRNFVEVNTPVADIQIQESIRNTGKFNVGDKVKKGKRIATIKKVDSPEKGYLDVEFEDGKDNGSYPRQYFRKITELKDMTETLKSLKEYFAIVDVESGDIVDDGDDAVFDTKEEAEQSMFDRIKFGVPAEWMEVKEFNVDGDLLESLKQTLKEAQDEEAPFIIGDTVALKDFKPIQLRRKGKVTKIISNDVVEVEFPEVPEQDLMARTDRYYTNELDKFTESLNDIQKPDLNQFKFTDYPNEDGQSYKGRETYRKALQSVLDEIDRRLNKCKYDYSGDTSPIKQAQFIVNDIWRNESVRDSLNLNSSTVKRQPGLYNAIKAVKDYQQQLINELKPLTIWNGKEWVEENKSKNESEEDIMFGVEMFLDTVEGDPEPGLVEFTKTGLIEFLNDYGYDLPMDAANDEVQECAEDFGMVVKYIK